MAAEDWQKARGTGDEQKIREAKEEEKVQEAKQDYVLSRHDPLGTSVRGSRKKKWEAQRQARIGGRAEASDATFGEHLLAKESHAFCRNRLGSSKRQARWRRSNYISVWLTLALENGEAFRRCHCGADAVAATSAMEGVGMG
ncbi:unnamed protein product [Durusdinium trenchii]|uniref:Uncharacterized protein n=1 Tax=Durusdinium trenchii TaxID=1381693 RepID=A0ABP0J5D9_9DINO